VTPDTDTIDVQSLDIACQAAPDGRLRWLGQPGNWVLREGGTARDCRLVGSEWQC
jgi:hypothetical protein